MGKRVKAWNVFSRVIFLLVFAVSVGVFYLTRTAGGYVDFSMNMIFDVLALVFIIIYFEACARPLARITAALANVTANIRASHEDAKALWARYGKNTSLFGNRRLDERYSAYLREAHRLQKQNSLTADCRIEDYISDDILYSAVNKPFCDQVGGIMSALGILFTFIGLVYGLSNFDASTVDAMQSSTQTLMAGIKVAFLTSIFGLIYSLIFGLVYKKLMKDSLETLYGFQDAFTEAVRPSNEHAAENALLQLQVEQNAALERFGSSVGEQVSESIITLMRPTVDELQRTITQYVTVAIEDQRAGMERVVRYFLDSMNSSLGNIFVQLKTRTEELARWEKDMTDNIRSMTDGIGKTYQDISQAQAACQQIIKSMSDYTGTIESLTAAQTNVTRQMERFAADFDKRREAEAALTRAMAESTRTAADNTEKSLQTAKAIEAMAAKVEQAGADSAQQAADAGRQLKEAAESIQAMAQAVTSDVNTAAARLERAAGDLEGGMSRSVSDSLALMDDSLARLGDSLGSVSSATDAVTQAIKSLPKTVASMDTDIKGSAKVIDAELKLLLKAVSDTQKIFNRFNADLERRTDR